MARIHACKRGATQELSHLQTLLRGHCLQSLSPGCRISSVERLVANFTQKVRKSRNSCTVAVTETSWRTRDWAQHSVLLRVLVSAEHEAAPFYKRKTKIPIGSDLGWSGGVYPRSDFSWFSNCVRTQHPSGARLTLSPLPDESKLVSVPVQRLLTTPRGV